MINPNEFKFNDMVKMETAQMETIIIFFCFAFHFLFRIEFLRRKKIISMAKWLNESKWIKWKTTTIKFVCLWRHI